MGLRPKRTRVAIANLGLRAVKKPRLVPDGPGNKENLPDVNRVRPLSVRERLERTLGHAVQGEERCGQLYFEAVSTSHVASEPGNTPAFPPSIAEVASPQPVLNPEAMSLPSISCASPPPAAFSTPTTSSAPSHDSHLPQSSVWDLTSQKLWSPPPTYDEAKSAYDDICELLSPRRKKGFGHTPFALGGDRLKSRMELMRSLLYHYHFGTYGWLEASVFVARFHEGGEWMARSIRRWTRAFIEDRHNLPLDNFHGKESLLEKHPEHQIELVEHLMGMGKYIRAMDIVEYMRQPEVMTKYGVQKPICLSTAQRWMGILDYRWSKAPTGQFADGHERPDVADYRTNTYLPSMARLAPFVCGWDKNNREIPIPPLPDGQRAQRVIVWAHDESTFYAHDRRLVRWVHSTEKAVPRTKGEGVSLMVADFVSAEYGWLRSPDGKESAQVLFEAGKNRDGYFTIQDILRQVTTAMDILAQFYPNERHVFLYDNASTHLARAPDALSARKMSLNPTQPGNPLWGVERTKVDANGRTEYNRDGSVKKEKIRMADATFGGKPQSLYFPEGHPRAGVFKGMRQILLERGISVAGKLAQCPNFACQPPAIDCCARRVLYNQPDFRDIDTLLQTQCKARGFEVIYLPKYHCELNPIEQCWCAAKRMYRQYPNSSAEADLRRNVVDALESVSLASIRRFFTRAWRFVDAYRYGLTGKQALWAAKKYSSHRVIPNTILKELDEAGITPD